MKLVWLNTKVNDTITVVITQAPPIEIAAFL